MGGSKIHMWQTLEYLNGALMDNTLNGKSIDAQQMRLDYVTLQLLLQCRIIQFEAFILTQWWHQKVGILSINFAMLPAVVAT